MRRLSFFLAFAALLIGAAGCSRSPLGSLPAPEHPEAVVAEARSLIASRAPSFVEEKEWPPAIRALHPLTVEVEPKAVVVTVQAKPGIGACGYLVAGGDAPSHAGFTLHPTADSALWQFDWHP